MTKEVGYPGVTVFADFDGDGIPDLATAELDIGPTLANRIRIYRGPSFAPAGDFDPGGDALAAAAVDLDGDGREDLVVALSPSSLATFRNTGSGGFAGVASMPIDYQTRGLVTGDLNKDGIADVAVGCVGAVDVLLGLGDGGLAASVSYPSVGVTGIVLGDFNADGLPDLAVSHPGEVGLFVNQGQGQFGAEQSFKVTPGPLLLAAGDFDGDGIVDLLVSNKASQELEVRLGARAGPLVRHKISAISDSLELLTVGDLDGDGALDAIGFANPAGIVAIFNQGDDTLEAALPLSTASLVTALGIGRFTTGAGPDVAVVSNNSPDPSSINVWTNGCR